MTISVIGSQEDTYSSGTPTTSRTINVASGTRTNGFIAVAVNVIGVSGSGNPTGVTWGGVALSPAIETGAPPHSSEWWYLFSPASGTADIVVSFAASGINGAQIVVVWGDSDAALTFGDTQTEARGTTDPTGISLVTTETGELCLSAYASADNNVATSGDTLLQDYASGGNSAAASYLIAGSPGTYELDWNRNSTGLASPFNLAAFSMYEAGTGDSPTVTQDTADDAVFYDDTPTLEFTGSDADTDDVRYNIQISDTADFTAGSQLRDNYDGTGAIIHPNPTPSDTTWQGVIQVDDRPGQSFVASGGILDHIDMEFGPDADTDGTAVVRVYAHQGTFGTSSEPLNAADPADTPTANWLAESDGLVFDTGGSSGWHQFDFSGANRIRLEAGQYYVLIIDWIPNDRLYDNTITVNGGTGLGHAGNAYIDGAAAPNNGVNATFDTNFRVYEESFVLDKVSGTDSGFENLDTPADTDPFTEGDAAAFTVQAGDALDDGLYFWRVRAKDPSGTDTYGDWSATRSFTVDIEGGISPLSITSAEAFGTAVLSGDITPGGIASSEAIGSHTLADEGFVQPTGIASDEAHGTAVLLGSVESTAIASAEAFGTPSLVGSIEPAAISSLEAFGTAVLSGDISPTSIASAEAFGVPLLVGFITPSGIVSGEVIGTAVLLGTIEPAGIPSDEAYGTAVFSGFITPTGIASGEATGSHTLAGEGTIVPTGIPSDEAHGTAVLLGFIAPSGIASDEAHGDTVVMIPGGSIVPTGIPSDEAFGSGQLNGQIVPVGVVSSEAFGTAVLLGFIQPTGIPTDEAAGSPTLVGLLSPAGILSAEAFGSAMLAYQLLPSAIASGELFGATVVFSGLPGAITSIVILAGRFDIPVGLQGEYVTAVEMDGQI